MSKFFGVLLLIVGILAVIFPLAAGLAGIIYIAAMLLIGGVIETAVAFKKQQSTGQRIFWIVLGLLTLAAGIFCWMHPVEGTVYAAFFIGCFFAIEGLIKLIAAYAFNRRGWLIFNGIISLLFGAYILFIFRTPMMADLIVGTLVGFNLIFKGITALSSR